MFHQITILLRKNYENQYIIIYTKKKQRLDISLGFLDR